MAAAVELCLVPRTPEQGYLETNVETIFRRGKNNPSKCPPAPSSLTIHCGQESYTLCRHIVKGSRESGSEYLFGTPHTCSFGCMPELQANCNN
uniref:Uncharacterized protein n=1 Tax=Ralstonia syzygii R24 TaxID=907261 RepID=G3A636_9RALS|nr:hypothetical protein RALSY_40111 [Ralstonia syzygii R24]